MLAFICVKRCGLLVAQIAERRFEAQPITFTQWVVLMEPSRHPHLAELKLVRREPSEHDRRAVRITVTAEGRRLAKATMPVVVNLANAVVAPYSKAETNLLLSLLQRMLGHMERMACAASGIHWAKIAAGDFIPRPDLPERADLGSRGIMFRNCGHRSDASPSNPTTDLQDYARVRPQAPSTA